MAQVANYVESNTSLGKLNCPFLYICNGGNFIFWQLPDTQVNLTFDIWRKSICQFCSVLNFIRGAYSQLSGSKMC